jgi:glycosyltransferase involved in cell wall biosynthesis
MTVWNREYEVLLATLRALSRCDLTDCEVIVADDGSTMDYAGIRAYCDSRLGNCKWIDVPQYDAFRIQRGFNNPARAFNSALLAATGDNVVIMSSDVMVTPKVLERIRRFDLSEMAFTPLVLDMESGQHYCGPTRLFPMPWCLAASRAHCMEIGGWDETYLNGMCYEDNDFVGRLVMQSGRFLADWTVCAYHQSHDQPAYDIKDPAVKAANERNKTYTMEKWSGIPFSGGKTPFDIIRKPFPTGDVVHEVRWTGTLKEDVIARTRGIVADARVGA